ncbi:hypothetical protein ST37_07360 [Vibrio sp. qd031]|uniref:hypothetical protein n=1 Tax=Vibrio sp. qd031 TaxID=1603038 RepID=UPI000A11C2E6|nr:hypothetical protein [Vibrio sp. qd031]ORT51158.1 hypothetical protein ST37_07360 [Vibrio sp. qd031]
MSASKFRQISRLIHLAMAAILGTYIYSPWGANPIFANFIMWFAIPVVSVTGVMMWKQGVVMKALKNRLTPVKADR